MVARSAASSRTFASGRGFRVDPQLGGGGGQPPPDPAAIITSGPTLVSKTLTTITLTWTANQFVQSWLQYGAMTDYGSESTHETSFNFATHVQTITGLTAGTTYHFRPVVVNQAGLQTIGSDIAVATESLATSVRYGPLVNIDSKSNLRVTTSSRGKVAMRFRATSSGETVSVRFAQRGGSGYSLGDGGTFRVGIQTDDGTSNHRPTGTWLGYGTYSPGNPGGDWEKWDTITFSNRPTLTEGTIYHLVFENIHASQATNYFSVNCAFTFESLTPRYPLDPDDLLGVFGTHYPSSSGQWQLQGGFLPCFDLLYANGVHDGIAYVNNRRNDSRAIGGNNQVRERFTSAVTGTFTGAWLRMNRQSGSGNVTAAMKQGTTTLGSGTVAATEFPSWTIASDADTGNWKLFTFNTPVSLTASTVYDLVLTAPSGTECRMVPVTYEFQAGQSFGSWAFKEGTMQHSTNAGSSWSSSASLHPNMQFWLVPA